MPPRGNDSPIGLGSSRDLGESVLLLGQIEFTSPATTGIKFSQEIGEVFEFRAGKIVHARDFLTHAGEALEAAGLRE